MRLLVISALVGCTLAAPQGYNAPAATVGSFGGFSGGGGYGGGGLGGGGGVIGGSCGKGQVLNIDGSCVTPVVTRNVFVYAAPQQDFNFGPPPQIPPPQVDFNIVFIRTPEGPEPQDPIVIPPPQQKTIVYVLSKNGDVGGPQVIEVPAGPNQTPEVFYVNYNEGDNPTLPGGITLQEALSSASQQGQLIGGGKGGFGGVFGGGKGGGGGVVGGGYSAPSSGKY